MNELDKYTSFDLDERKCKLENELKEMIVANEIVEQQKLFIQRDIIKLQLAKKELEMALSKSHADMKQKQIEIKITTSQFWVVKNEGR